MQLGAELNCPAIINDKMILVSTQGEELGHIAISA
jgi:hypothetical protein